MYNSKGAKGVCIGAAASAGILSLTLLTMLTCSWFYLFLKISTANGPLIAYNHADVPTDPSLELPQYIPVNSYTPTICNFYFFYLFFFVFSLLYSKLHDTLCLPPNPRRLADKSSYM